VQYADFPVENVPTAENRSAVLDKVLSAMIVSGPCTEIDEKTDAIIGSLRARSVVGHNCTDKAFATFIRIGIQSNRLFEVIAVCNPAAPGYEGYAGHKVSCVEDANRFVGSVRIK
jgi:hypothetical protein